jgi:RNA polymerase sigma factor (sigma-70 family)
MAAQAVTIDDVVARPDHEGFEAFYRANADRVYRALAVTLRRDDLAAEAVAEAMSRACARWSTVRRLENPAGWVFRVGLNWATSWWRKVRWESPPADESAHPRTRPPDGSLAAREALAKLPEPQRAVITCRVLLEFSTAETADALRISEGTVKSRLARGLATLRHELNSED